MYEHNAATRSGRDVLRAYRVGVRSGVLLRYSGGCMITGAIIGALVFHVPSQGSQGLKPAVAILGKCGMMRDFLLKAQPCEPTPRQMHS